MAPKKFLINLYNYFHGLIDYIILNFFMKFPSRFFRKLICKLRFQKIGKDCFFGLALEFRKPKNIFLENNVIINKNVLLDGRGGKILIKNNVDIAQETNIWTLEHNIHDNYHGTTGGDVTIEEHVWIASRVTILPGVKIGKGAVIASNSVVTKNVEPMTVVGGIPAKFICKRHNELLYKLNYQPFFK